MRAHELVDPGALVRDAAALVQVPSVTGDERAALERLGELAAALGLEPELRRHDLAALRAHPDHPGEEAPRDELWGLTVRAPGGGAARRVALCGHVDVVAPGTVPWAHGPWSGVVADGWLHGRGSVDMKGATVAALHALAAHARTSGGAVEAVLLAVASEEDGGLGAFAAVRDDAAFDLCVIPEPTGFDVVCAQAGALTFTGTVPGVAAHAAQRLEGVSAIDRYVPVHAALAALEAELNADVAHPLMRELPLPYPLLVGRLAAGEWSSSVPDRLDFEGRAPVRVGEDPGAARAAVEAAVRAACPEASVAWTGGQFASAQTDHDGPVARLALAAVGAELGRPGRVIGVPYGADMRLFCAAGVPTVMVGPPGIELAHAVDERVAVDDLVTTARVLARILDGADAPA
ncbi:M20 family metallopeptidase [Conexibacter sp. SYSU D00693]|uniref:M20 family metallopeptidase n=1 Tax=Conexibacter sp. SYSU D00693 TaxID=2812560 RepID=UPI00196B194A|nr:M20/M25/M40 family metallo-hydrolase [Conexibacter sp. SYSU D00693]